MHSPKIVLLYILMAISIGHCYQYVRFVNNNGNLHQPRKSSSSRNLRTFGHYHPIISPFPELWPEEIVWSNDGHILEYTIETFDDALHTFNHIGNDPFFSKGTPSNIQHILQKGLFFSDIPHVKSLLRNQDIRRRNGLNGIRLGSLRRNSPFARTHNSYYHTRK